MTDDNREDVGPAATSVTAKDFARKLRTEIYDNADDRIREAADFIDAQQAKLERLQLELDAEWKANHEIMWQDTLIPLAEAANIPLVGLDGNKRQFQMVDDLIAAIKRQRELIANWVEAHKAVTTGRASAAEYEATTAATDALYKEVEGD